MSSIDTIDPGSGILSANMKVSTSPSKKMKILSDHNAILRCMTENP